MTPWFSRVFLRRQCVMPLIPVAASAPVAATAPTMVVRPLPGQNPCCCPRFLRCLVRLMRGMCGRLIIVELALRVERGVLDWVLGPADRARGTARNHALEDECAQPIKVPDLCRRSGPRRAFETDRRYLLRPADVGKQGIAIIEHSCQAGQRLAVEHCRPPGCGTRLRRRDR